ncbi:MAG: beta-ketoacyl-ACP synthase III [Alphaproteobacteria bacterium]
MKCSKIISCGAYLPDNILTNKDLERTLDTTDEWIKQRCGIERRHIADSNSQTSDLALKAASQAIKTAFLNPLDIECIIVASTTPDNTFPAVATKIQKNLGAFNAFAFDVQAVCAGFIYALSVADNFIKTSFVKNALVIGCDTLSKLLDWSDRQTAILFGDGAGAFVLKSALPDHPNRIISTNLFSDGRFYDSLYVDNKDHQHRGFIKMNGREVFKNAVHKMEESSRKILKDNNISANDIDWFVPHQANIRIIQSLANALSIPIEKVIITINEHANTSAASIPLAIYKGVKDGRIKKGDLILTTALGAGLSWGTALIRW